MHDNSNESSIIDCPGVFFSSENNTYADGEEKDINLDKINYKATLNNYGFVGNCISNFESNNYNLDILILVEPINPKNNNINLPIFVLLYDLDNKLIDKQYFRIKDNLEYNNESSEYQITEVLGQLNIFNEVETEIGSMTIGFIKIK